MTKCFAPPVAYLNSPRDGDSRGLKMGERFFRVFHQETQMDTFSASVRFDTRP